jgi:hypothetical protein
MPEDGKSSVDRCPQCGAAMRPVWIGELKDKFLECEHCRSRVDVPDEVTIEEESSEHGHDDRGRRVHTSRKRTVVRRDLPGDGGEDRAVLIDEAFDLGTPVIADDEVFIRIDLGDREAVVDKLEKYLRKTLPTNAVIDIDRDELLTHFRGLGSENLFVPIETLHPTGENKVVTTTDVVTHTVVDDGELSLTSSALRRPPRPEIPLSAIIILAAVVGMILLVIVLG